MHNMTPEEQLLDQKVKELIQFSGSDPQSFQSDLVSQIILSSLKMLKEDHDTGELKLMTRAFKEMRYAYSIFNKHTTGKMISIFGSARTPEDHPDYIAAKVFSAAMAAKGWICITGAAAGIMQAGLEGAQRASSVGLSIRLPFEIPSHSLLAGDPKLITFRYFFTRKLMFLSHSDAVAAFPGGVGTQDELYEVLTLMQTGKSNIIPVVLIQGDKGDYWQEWIRYIKENLLDNGWVSAEDFYFFYLASNVSDAVDHITHFYSRYHSSRYVKDILVIRMLSEISEDQLAELNRDFSALLKEGKIYKTGPLEEEDDHLTLSRIAFEHNHQHFGLLRHMFDRINSF